MQQLEDLTLLKRIGKGSFGEVYLTSKAGRNELFATKKMDRKHFDTSERRKYLVNEITILQECNHPNIIRLEEIKYTKDHYYVVTEYCNGGSLTDCLETYRKLNHGKAFPEEIVQYLMRQIVDAVQYLHNKKILHRDLKLDNILVNFNNEIDKSRLNMLKCQVKIIDFGFAIKLDNKSITYSTLGSPINMDPRILRKLNKRKGTKDLGYDAKADIWSLGTLCYEMLIGQSVFDANDMRGLERKVEKGSYSVPTTLSKEMVSFLNGMLQYDSKLRFSANELDQHHFLTKDISEFHPIDLKKVRKKVDRKGLNINTKKNSSIWAIFNEETEEELANVPQTLDYNSNSKNTNTNYNNYNNNYKNYNNNYNNANYNNKNINYNNINYNNNINNNININNTINRNQILQNRNVNQNNINKNPPQKAFSEYSNKTYNYQMPNAYVNQRLSGQPTGLMGMGQSQTQATAQGYAAKTGTYQNTQNIYNYGGNYNNMNRYGAIGNYIPTQEPKENNCFIY